MAKALALAGSEGVEAQGRVLNNPISGERIVIRRSGAETGGKLLLFELFLPIGGHVPAGHTHPLQEERFTVVSGRMRFRMGRRTILANQGETVHIAPGTAHWFGNAGPDVAHAVVEVRPALRMEELFEATSAMGMSGRFLRNPLPRLADMALCLVEFQSEIAVPNVPGFLARALLTPLAWLGRRRRRNRFRAGNAGEPEMARPPGQVNSPR